MGWRLQPAVIRTVLAQTEVDLEAMDSAWAEPNLEGVVDELTRAGDVGADVTGAVVAVLNAQAGRLTSMGNRVSAGVAGVGAATDCFELGQEEMLAQCQTQMLTSAASGDFSWWYGSSVPDGAV